MFYELDWLLVGSVYHK